MSDIDEIELKPCPFCGGEAEMMGDQYPYVECHECGAGFTTNHSYEFDEGDAASKWNARSAAGDSARAQGDAEPVAWVTDAVSERERQDGKWGGPSHDDQKSPNDFVQLIEDYAGWARVMAGMGSINKYRRRMVQVAALAGAAIEYVDRHGTRQQPPQEGEGDE